MSEEVTPLEVCFADVAQGSAAVILFGNRRAAVIDCGGRQTRTVIELLHRFRIDTIVRLVITHNHADHSAGAASLLTAFRGRVEQIWMLFDTVLHSSIFWARVMEEIVAGRLNRTQLRRLERAQAPQEVYRDGNALLAVIAPDMLANIQAVDVGDPNRTCGVLLLKSGHQRVLFAGDSTIPEWRAIMSLDSRPFRCVVMTVPHHGGKVWAVQQSAETDAAYTARVRAELDWLYTTAIQSQVGIVSVGSSNPYRPRHPRQEVMAARRRANVVPVCTQMTAQCAPDLETQRARSLPLILPGRSTLRRDSTDSGASRNVPCGGTILAEVHADRLVIHRFGEHQAMVAEMPQAPGEGPLCRR